MSETTSSAAAAPDLNAIHLAHIRDFYETRGREPSWTGQGYRSLLARYYRHFIPAEASVLEVGCGQGGLLAMLPNRDVTGVDVSPRQIEAARRLVPHGIFHVMSGEELQLDRTFDYIILSDTINEAADVQRIFERLRACARADTRLILNYYSNLWRPLLALLQMLGLKAPHPAGNWLARGDVRNLLELAGWESVTTQPRLLCPARIPLLGFLANRIIAPLPLFQNLCLAVMTLARPLQQSRSATAPTVSVIIPARNEAGNLEAAVARTPEMGSHTELIFIEGHSQDDTWKVMSGLPERHPNRSIRVMRQTGKGKGNAVREAFAAAQGDILMILDADLTMPPEELPKYYAALASGQAEFVNGVRLVYPMEDEAMRFLNMCANKAFSILFTWLLGQPVRDTLCGTKVLFRRDYEKIAANRAYFGNFDPFGDFDLLFGAAKLNLRFADIPIRYRNRTYGSTNISRWKHGWLLLRMVTYAAGKLKFI